MKDFVLTSEAVSPAHPDKLCDQISDAVVDACLAADPEAACIAECALAGGIVFLSVRHDRRLDFDPAATARRVLEREGPPDGRGPPTVMLETAEAAGGADRLEPSVMTTAFGYACDHHASRMPAPIRLAHAVTGGVTEAAGGTLRGRLSPDATVQVAVRFEERRPVAVEAVALSVFVAEGTEMERAREALTDAARGALEAAGAEAPERLLVHRRPGLGGAGTHAGLTGRKTAGDAYGGASRISGSALSGKDPSRPERAAMYAARQAAVSVVAAGLAAECEVQISYVAGESAPATVEIDCFDTAGRPEAEIAALLQKAMDLRLPAIVERLELRHLPRRHGGEFYRRLARGTHFGRDDLEAPWDSPVDL